ncbi:MAG: O-antigen ligase family protein [Patescibacteria group bacterium]
MPPPFDQKIINIIKFGLYLSLLTPLLWSTSLLFPFVTARVFFFRLLIEILSVLYLYIVFKHPRYRPRKTMLFSAILAYTVILLISGLLGVDWNLSFWGDIERMGGIFTWLHLAVYFTILTAVFKTEKDWKYFISTFIGVGLAVAFYGLAQKFSLFSVYNVSASRIDSTTGNPSYLAAYIIFQIFFVIYLSRYYQNKYARLLFVLLFALFVLTVFFTGTRGAFLGLSAGVCLFLFFNVFLSSKHKYRIISAVALATILLFGIFSIVFNDVAASRMPFLTRFLDISLSDSTINTRFISWRAAWQGYLERPILGAGPENFAIVFDKFFDPSFYTFTRTETYFDRAHSVFFELMATSGTLGLISYFFIFFVVIFYVVDLIKTKELPRYICISFAALLLAYLIQNLFVFDSINSLIPFVATLALLEFLRGQAVIAIEEQKINKNEENKIIFPNGLQKAIVAISILVVLYMMFAFNIKPVRAIRDAVKASRAIYIDNDLLTSEKLFLQALDYHTVLDRDIRSHFATAIVTNIVKFGGKLPKEDINRVFEEASVAMKKNLEYNPRDNFFNLRLGELYNMAADFQKILPEEAEKYLTQAILASPGRLTGYYALSHSKLIRRDYDEAIKVAKQAVDMNPLFVDSYLYLAQAYRLAGNTGGETKTIKAAILLGYDIPDRYGAEKIIQEFVEVNDYQGAIMILKNLVDKNPNDALLYGRLAMAYAAIGDQEKAKENIIEAERLDSSLKPEVELFLQKLYNGELAK